MPALQFEVTGQSITRMDSCKPVAKCQNYYTAHFTFLSDEWQGVKTALFTMNGKSIAMVLDDTGDCLVPWEFFDVSATSIGEVSVFCGDLITANVAHVLVTKSGYTESSTSEPPTSDVYTQLADLVGQAVDTANSVREEADSGAFKGEQGPSGKDGESASITIGSVTTGAPGSQAEVTNSGTSQNAILNFVIPQGPVGPGGSEEGGGDTIDDSQASPDHPWSGQKINEELSAKAPVIVCNASGETIQVNDALDQRFMGLKVFGKTLQNGSPSIENPVPIEVAGSGGSVTITVSGGTSDQHLLLTTPNGLPAIPVDSGGNYTDQSGQQWVSDYVDFENGQYVQHVAVYKAEDLEWRRDFYNSSGKEMYRYSSSGHYTLINRAKGLCNCFTWIYSNPTLGINFGTDENKIRVFLTEAVEDIDALIRLFQSKGTIFYLQLATPVVTPLTDQEIESYQTLVTNKTNTTVSSDSTPQVGIEMDYMTDTKTYIDNQFSALAQQILNNI